MDSTEPTSTPTPAPAPRTTVPYRQIRAHYDDSTITVYQAYNHTIANAAIAEQKLHASPSFRPTRMTWIKPSWSWMLYRAGYSYKDKGQERILALKMKHEHFIGLLEKAVLTFKPYQGAADESPGNDSGVNKNVEDETVGEQSAGGDNDGDGGDASRSNSFGRKRKEKPADVKVQWDPERSVRIGKLEHRSIQIGIPAAISPQWTKEWIVSIEDVTDRARELKRALDEKPGVTNEELVQLGLVPVERPFEILERLQILLGMVE